MIAILILLLVALIFLPQFWVKSVLSHYHQQDEPNFTGTGGEFAEHILQVEGINNVTVEITEQGEHYDPMNKTVRLSKPYFEGKTLTAITIAAHECGHAIQDVQNDRLFNMRSHLVTYSVFASRLGSFLLFCSPLSVLIARAPSAAFFNIAGAALILGFAIVVHLATLPVELDASFNKAMPILQRGYLSSQQLKGAKKILRAAAMTYVAASLAGLFNFWRWFQVLRK